MPSMLEHEANKLVKVLVAADSGSGKTGSLACLADEGFNLRILDFDNGLSPLKHYVKNKANLANIYYQTLRDELRLVGGKFTIRKASAFNAAMNFLDKGDEEAGIPPLTEWGPQDILVVDSFGKMGRSALLLVMQINGALAKSPEIQHYGVAMENMEKFLEQITSPRVGCHVIINTHLSKEEGSVKQHPESLGSKLNPKVARNFDNFFSISITGKKRTIKTERDGTLALKCAKKLDTQYDISDGWVKIFQELTGVKPLSKLWESAE